MVTGMAAAENAEGKEWRHMICNSTLAVLHSEYFPNSENADAVVNYVVKNHLPLEQESYEQAFEVLERRGEILPRHLQRSQNPRSERES